jgi:DNA adenine methylase
MIGATCQWRVLSADSRRCRDGGSARAAAEMGRRQALAGALPRAAVAAARHRRLVEPFCGGLAVALGLRPERALLNDVNPHVIAFYRWLQRGLRIDLPLENDETLYYAHRDPLQRAAGRRGRRRRRGGRPLLLPEPHRLQRPLPLQSGRRLQRAVRSYQRIRYTRDFAAWRDVLAPWVFTHGDIESIPLDDSDFVYADPPYDVPFTHYARGGFSWDDQVRAATRLAAHAGPVVLVNQATPRVVELYASLGFELRYLDAPRRHLLYRRSHRAARGAGVAESVTLACPDLRAAAPECPSPPPPGSPSCRRASGRAA